jgi:hypothetical protein
VDLQDTSACGIDGDVGVKEDNYDVEKLIALPSGTSLKLSSATMSSNRPSGAQLH